MTSPTLRRRTTAATAALLLGLSLAACGGDDSGSDDDERSSDESPSATTDETETSEPVEPTTSDAPAEPAGVPSEEELVTALVSAADVPPGMTEGEPDDDSGDSLEGTCLGEIGEFDDALGFEPDVKAETEFTAEDNAGQSMVSSSISAYADGGPVAEAFTTFVSSLQGCTTISTTDDEGIAYDLQIAYDDTVDLVDADQQLRAEVTGTIAGGGQSFDITDSFVVMLRDNFVSFVGTSQVGTSDVGVLALNDPLAVLQAQRLADLVG